MNENWIKWIRASISVHFSENLEYYTYIEGDPRADDQPADRVEIRICGPVFDQLDKNSFEAHLSINILVHTLRSSDAYKHDVMKGKVATKMLKAIPVYKYPDDVDSYVGCLLRDDQIRTDSYDSEAEVQTQIGVVDADYTLTLDLGD